MKRSITTAIIILAALGLQAQQRPTNQKGSWVIESNIKHPKIQTVKVYNNRGRLVYEEVLSKAINIDKPKTRALMNAICERINRQKQLMANGVLITATFEMKK